MTANSKLFEPLEFRNLRVKNRIFRSNISGRFDNYDGSGNQARINWETKFLISNKAPQAHGRPPTRR
jgi:2,4-dienoyl-CoA reductase-like NADH-dependent reductase (Old Yellow Enzyme family)